MALRSSFPLAPRFHAAPFSRRRAPWGLGSPPHPCSARRTAPLEAPAVQLSGPVEFWSRETADNGARQPLINAHLAAFDQRYGTQSTAQFMVFQESIQKTQARWRRAVRRPRAARP